MNRNSYNPHAGVGSYIEKFKIDSLDGRPGFFYDKVSTSSGIYLDYKNTEGYKSVVIAGGPELVRQTTGTLHVYADGTSGSDSNTGLSLTSPKKTLGAVFDIVPLYVNHNVCIHISGIFTDSSSSLIRNSNTNRSSILLIDGGDGTTVVSDDSGSPWTSDINSVWSIGKTGLSWTTDQWWGYWVEIASGPALGETRQIYSNTATSLVPVRKWSVDPGVGAQFRIVRPTTYIQGALLLGLLGGCISMRLQRVYIAGASSYLRLWSSGMVVNNPIEMDQIIINSSSYNSIYGNSLYTYYGYTDTTTFERAASGPAWIGVSSIGSSVSGDYFDSPHDLNLCAFSSNKLTIVGASRMTIDYGSRIKNLVITGLAGTGAAFRANIDASSANFRPTLIGGGTGVGLDLRDSSLRIVSATVSGCVSHGISCRHSLLHLDGAVAGNGNSGAGVYAHSGSIVHIKTGSPPTISGTIGHFSTDGTTQRSTWTVVAGGTTVSDTGEMTMFKRIT